MAIKVRAKAADRDFLPEQLPQTRRSQFFEILKSRFGLILKCGLILFAFGLILIGGSIAKSVYNANFYAQLQAGTITDVECNNYVAYTNFLASLIYVPGFCVFLVGLAGVVRIMRQLVIGEGILFREDFKLGVKNNWKQFVLYGFVFSAFNVLLMYAMFASANSSLSIFITVLLTILYVVGLTYLFVFVLYANIYTSRGLELIKNVSMSLGKGKFWGIFYIIVSILPIILICLLTTGILYGILLVIYFIFLLPIIVLIGNSYFSNVFDELFNYSQYPHLVKSGLYIAPSEKKVINQIHKRKYKEIENEIKKRQGGDEDAKK